jgi:WD40 repeat protein
VVVADAGTGAVLQRLNDPPAPGTGDSTSLRVTRDGRVLVVAGMNVQSMMAYDVRTGAPKWRQAHETGANTAIDATGNIVWAQEAGSGSSRMFPYDLDTGERIANELNGQHGTACDAKTSPDGGTIAIASCNEGTISTWALDGRTATGRPLAPAGWSASADLWSLDGRYVAVLRDADEAVEVVDLEAGTRKIVPRMNGSIQSTPVFGPDNVLRGIDADRHLVDYDPKRGTTRDTHVVLPPGELYANVALYPPRGLRAYGLDDGLLHIVDERQGKIVRTIDTQLGPLYGTAFGRGGTRVFVAGQFEQTKVYDVRTGKLVATLPDPGATLTISADRRLLATGAFNGTIHFYDAATLRRAGDPLTGSTAFPAQMQFTRDGRTLAMTALDSTLRVYDVESRRQVGVPVPVSSFGMVVAPDGQQIAITTDRGVQRLRVDTDALRRAACDAAGRNLTTAEWRQYIGGTPRRLCPQFPLQ